ncbi:MAG: activator of alkane oxidation [Pseudomonadota bacterium]
MLTRVLVIGLVAGMTIATQAAAFSFTPKGVSFVAKGRTTLNKGGTVVPCKARLAGLTTATGVGHITSALFGGSAACGAITATGLPWKVTATSGNTAVIANVSFNVAGAGNCGPSSVPATVTTTGKFKFNSVPLGPNCVFDGAVNTAPPVTITSP